MSDIPGPPVLCLPFSEGDGCESSANEPRLGHEAASDICPHPAPTAAMALEETPGQTRGLHRDTLSRAESLELLTGGLGWEHCASFTQSQSSPGTAGLRARSSKPVPGPPQPRLCAHSRCRLNLRSQVHRPVQAPSTPFLRRSVSYFL